MYKKNLYQEIYSKFYIKIYGSSGNIHYNQLAGIPLLTKLLGRVLCHKILGQALYSDLEKVTFKFRRGLLVTFYSK